MRGFNVQLPKRKWTPQWLAITTMMLLIFTVAFANGTYMGSTIVLTGTLGTTTEDIMMSFYAGTLGIVAANPLQQKIRLALTPKTLIISDLILQVFLSIVCGHSESILIITICSFFLGMLKTIVITQFIVLMSGFFSPDNVRSEYLSWFFPIIFGMGQLSMSFTAWLAYNYQWQYIYYCVAALILLILALIIVFFRDMRRPVIQPFKDINYRGVLLAASGYMFVVYALIYGQTLDWFASDDIRASVVLGLLLLALFFADMYSAKKTYVSLKVLKHWKTPLGCLFLFFCMFFNGDTSLVNRYLNYVLGLDSVHTYSVFLWTIPGYVIAGIVAFWWFRWQRWRFRYLISACMALYAVYFAIIYFGLSPESRYEMLFIPMIIKGAAMMTLVIAFGVYMAEDLPRELWISNTFFQLSFRSLLTPVVAYCFFTNMLTRLQLGAMDRLSRQMSVADEVAVSRWRQYFDSALAGGMSYDNAVLSANNSLNSILQTQGMLIGIKTIYGWLFVAAAAVAVVSAFIHFHETVKVPVVKTGSDMA